MKKLFSLSLLFFIFFIFTGCLQKQSDGKYHTQYSYHPYFDKYTKKMAPMQKRYMGEPLAIKHTYSKKKINVSYAKPKKRVFQNQIAYNDENKYPSNIPIK